MQGLTMRGVEEMMHRTSSRVLLIVAAFVLLMVPVAAIGAGSFEDVDEGNVFKGDIAWLSDAGVTRGCNPPTNTKFCPSDYVTREQMAAFMHRLAVNRIVDAATALEADYAIDAGHLDGKDSTAFAASGHRHDADYLAIGAKATDADKIDGLTAHELVRVGEGRRSGTWEPNNNDQYMTISVIAPNPGYIYATGSTTIRAKPGASPTDGECVLTMKEGGNTTYAGYVEWDVADTDGSRKDICTPVALFQVDRAGTYDIGMEFNWYESAKADLSWGNMVAMYAPFYADGSKP